MVDSIRDSSVVRLVVISCRLHAEVIGYSFPVFLVPVPCTLAATCTIGNSAVGTSNRLAVPCTGFATLMLVIICWEI